MPKQEKSDTVLVIPSPDLPPTEYLPGIGADGTEVPASVAEDLINRGLAVRKPDPQPEQEQE